MSYLERLTDDMKAAMKSGARERLEVVRMLIAGIRDAQLKSSDDLDEARELAVLQKAVKTRRDSVEQAEKVGRQDVADRERAEIAIIQEYLPAMMSTDEIEAKVKELAANIGYSGPQDTGRFMKEWMSRYKGLADGRDVQTALRDL